MNFAKGRGETTKKDLVSIVMVVCFVISCAMQARMNETGSSLPEMRSQSPSRAHWNFLDFLAEMYPAEKKALRTVWGPSPPMLKCASRLDFPLLQQGAPDGYGRKSED